MKEKDQPDLLFENLNSNHPNIMYAIEIMSKFLETKIFYEDIQMKTEVQRNEKKLPVHWKSKIPRLKRNAINADLKVTSATKRQLLKMCHLRHILRTFYFVEKLCSVLKIFKFLYF